MTKRRRDLGVAAAITQPGHVIDLIGAVPSDNPAAVQLWTNMAGRIEAYREEWGVAPQQLRERPLDACQAREWDVAVHSSEMLARPAAGLRPEVLVVGGPHHVAGELRQLASVGFTDVLVRHLADDQSDVLASFDRLAEVRRLVADA